MAFLKKTWKDTIAEYPNRRVLTNVSTGDTSTVTVTRSIGTVSQEGDAWNAENMNDLEDRIGNEFTTINSNLVANEFTITTSMWVADSASEEFGYKATFSTNKYTNTFVPLYVDIIPSDGSAFFSEEELEWKNGGLNYMAEVSANGFTVWANDIPTVDLKFRVGGEG